MDTKKSFTILACLLLAGGLLVTTTLAEDSDTRIHIRKVIHDCDGDDADCDHRVVIEGDRMAWMAGHGHRWLGHGGKGGYLGVTLTELTPELRTHFGAPEEAGVLVSKVLEDSPAARAGLQVGDVISAVDGEAVGAGGELARAIRAHGEGELVSLELWRDQRLEVLEATLEKRQGFGLRGIPGMVIDCEDEGDCDFHFGHGFDCGGEDCELDIECGDGDCTCTVNGEATDCEEVRGLHRRHQR